MRHVLTFAGKDMADFGVHISGEETWKKPAADYERVSVPGRNGDLLFYNRRFENVDIKYPCGIVRDFDTNFVSLTDFLFSHTGYQRLEDSYHPDYYRLAFYSGDISPEMTRLNREGKFNLTFNAKPQMYLKTGEQKLIITEETEIYNPCSFDARPLMRVYGTGEITIGDNTLTINTADVYTDIDCEMEDAYKDGPETNCNGNISLSEDTFPVLTPGRNKITPGTGIFRIELTPRWWRL